MSEILGPVYSREDYAGFLRRTAAITIDAVILSVAAFALPWGWYYLAPVAWVTDAAYGRIDAICGIGSLAYLLGFRCLVKGTPGYRIVGIRYVYMLAQQPDWTALAYRAIMAVFLMWLFALDHLWILFDPRKQAWHDKVTGFYVVKSSAQPIGRRRVVRPVINFMMLTFVVWEPAGDEPPACVSS